jgi:hypothetical protein
MTKREAERRTMMDDALRGLGFTRDECDSLRRISMTLQRWHELECGTDNGCIERDETTNKPYLVSEWGAQWGTGKRCRRAIPDRETGARKRLAAIVAARNASLPKMGLAPVSTYVQTDPRGAALYIIRPGDVPAGADVGAYYSRGICVY